MAGALGTFRDLLRHQRAVVMLASVGGDLVAGRRYRLPAHVADELILKGYADGKLSRGYSPDETAALRGPTQVVTFDG